MTENIQWLEVHARKAGDEWILDVLGAPFYGPDMGKDIEGDYFSPNTNFMMEIGDKRPVLYFHGDTPWGTPDYMPEVIGRATATRKDGKGLWFEVVLDKTKKHAARIWNAAVKGIAKASTGAVNYLVRRNKVTGELLTWPIGELTLVD